MGAFGTVVKGAIVALVAFIAAKKMSTAMETLKSPAGSIASGFLERARGILPGGGGGGAAPPTGAPPMGPLGAAGAAAGGGGGGFVGFVKSLGRGLASLAPIAIPMLIGAGAVAGVITLLGAGVAAAIALVGLSLPVFAKGLTENANIDGVNLIAVAAGIGALGIAMVAFTAGSVIGGLGAIGSNILNFFSGGGPIAQIQESVTALSPILPQLTALGPAINSYAQGIVAFGKAVNSVDIGKAEKLKDVLKGPSAAEQIANTGAQMIKAATVAITGQGSSGEKSQLELAALNTTMKEILKYMKDTADNTKRNIDATKGLNGNLFA
jgi:hypothetical protein